MESKGLCTRCVMDVSAKEIIFDEQGVCNFCHTAQQSLKDVGEEKHRLPQIIKDIKDAGKGRDYDVLIGLSGGIDSSYTLHKAVELGLRPLCFSVDNGWNLTNKADENIMRMVESLKVPFFRYTIDLGKFRELQSAFMKAGVRNIEIPTDHIILATTMELARKYKIKWILSGGNVSEESIMPGSWGANARDLRHIKTIYKQFVGKKLTGLPLYSLLQFNIDKWFFKIKMLYLLDYL